MTGSIDRSVAGAVVAAVATTDFEALRAGLGPGVCNACVDGIDVIVVFHAAEGEPLFNSATVALDGAVFAAVADAVQAMGAASDLPIISR